MSLGPVVLLLVVAGGAAEPASMGPTTVRPAIIGPEPPPVAAVRSLSADTLNQLLQDLEHEDTSPLGRVRVLYHRAVFDGDGIEPAERALAGAREAPMGGEPTSPLLDAYEGSLELLRARDQRWPPARLASLRSGMSRLDDAVRRAPDDLEIRYLRLASEANLPGVFRRNDVVREDHEALCRGPGTDAPLPPAMRALVEAFLATIPAAHDLRRRQHGEPRSNRRSWPLETIGSPLSNCPV